MGANCERDVPRMPRWLSAAPQRPVVLLLNLQQAGRQPRTRPGACGLSSALLVAHGPLVGGDEPRLRLRLDRGLDTRGSGSAAASAAEAQPHGRPGRIASLQTAVISVVLAGGRSANS